MNQRNEADGQGDQEAEEDGTPLDRREKLDNGVTLWHFNELEIGMPPGFSVAQVPFRGMWLYHRPCDELIVPLASSGKMGDIRTAALRHVCRTG